MIVTKDFPDKSFASKEDLFKALRDNKKELIASKLSTVKYADAFYTDMTTAPKDYATKAEGSQEDIKTMEVKFVVNSCGIFDSHGDVHVNGCWKKTAKETKNSPHLNSHRMEFESVISTNTKWSNEVVNIDKWGDLECLVMTSKMERDRNEYMFKQYKNGYVTQHSVGLRYIAGKYYLCINSDSKYDVEEKENYDKYISQVVNKEDVESVGYFWAVTEAKAIEASAVVLGSNQVTPIISIEENKQEPSSDTQKQIHEPTMMTVTQINELVKNAFKNVKSN